MKKVIELIRVSTAQQAADDRASIPAQREINRRTAKAHGLTIVKTVQMADVSGAAVLRAPEMLELLKDIEAPEIEGVVAREFSRLMRPDNFSDYAILQAFVDTKTILYLPDGPIDFSSKSGRLIGLVRGGMAGIERMELREKSVSAREEKRKQGRFASGRHCLPRGVAYDYSSGLWSYTDEAAKVKDLFERVAAGETNFVKLAEDLGISSSGVPVILSNPIYTGWKVYDKRRDDSPAGLILKADGRQGGRRRISRAPEEIIRTKVIDRPLVSEELFAHVQAMLANRRESCYRRRPGFAAEYEAYIYRGFLVCSKCDDLHYSYSVTSNGSRHNYYICRNVPKFQHRKRECDARMMRKATIEEKVDHVLSTRLTDRGFLREMLEEVDRKSKHDDSKSTILRLQGEISKLQAKRARIVDAYVDGSISKEDRDGRLSKIDRELVGSQRALMAATPRDLELDLTRILRLFAPLMDWQFLKRAEKQQVLTAISPRIHAAEYAISGITIGGFNFQGFKTTQSLATETGGALVSNKENRRGMASAAWFFATATRPNCSRRLDSRSAGIFRRLSKRSVNSRRRSLCWMARS
jgi:site-specific DNA recombinase